MSVEGKTNQKLTMEPQTCLYTHTHKTNREQVDKNKGKAENGEDGEDKRGKIKEGKQQK